MCKWYTTPFLFTVNKDIVIKLVQEYVTMIYGFIKLLDVVIIFPFLIMRNIKIVFSFSIVGRVITIERARTKTKIKQMTLEQ